MNPWGQHILSKFTDETELEDVVDPLGNALQRDLYPLEHWIINKWMKLTKGKCQILHLGWSNAGHRNRLRFSGWRAAQQKGTWECWSHHRESAMCPGSQEGKQNFGVHYTQHSRTVKTTDTPITCSVAVASP